MLIESLVKATVELQGFRVVRVTGGRAGLVAMITRDRRYSPRCGRCLEPAPYRDTRRTRGFRHVPMWGITVELRYAPRRVSCPRCEGVHVEAMPWVSGKRQMTRALMVTLATWARALPWQQVARLFRCSWGTVATAVEEAVAYGLAHRDLDGLTHIGIDEVSRKRGHVYVTNVYDLKHKRLVWSGTLQGDPRSLLRLPRAGENRCPRRHLLRYVATLHRRHQGPSAPGGARVRQVPHRPSLDGGRRPSAPRRGP